MLPSSHVFWNQLTHKQLSNKQQDKHYYYYCLAYYYATATSTDLLDEYNVCREMDAKQPKKYCFFTTLREILRADPGGHPFRLFYKF